jgi:hypothetical protein
MCLEGLEENDKSSIRIGGISAGIRTEYLPFTILHFYRDSVLYNLRPCFTIFKKRICINRKMKNWSKELSVLHS